METEGGHERKKKWKDVEIFTGKGESWEKLVQVQTSDSRSLIIPFDTVFS